METADAGIHGEGWGLWMTAVVFAVWAAALTGATIEYRRREVASADLCFL